MYNNAYGYNAYPQQMAQNRMSQIEQQYNVGAFPQNGYPVQNIQQTNTMQILKGRPVSSFDEAKASMIDLDGSLFVFTDVANNCIYTKQILLDGTAEIKTYRLEQKQNKNEAEIKTEQNKEYVLREEFENVVENLNKTIKELKECLEYDTTSNSTNV